MFINHTGALSLTLILSQILFYWLKPPGRMRLTCQLKLYLL